MVRFSAVACLSAFVAFGIMSCSTTPSEQQNLVCGKRIPVDEVLVVDLEASPLDQSAQLEEAQPFSLITEEPVGILNRGSRVQTLLSAQKNAAKKGCNLLLVGPIHSQKKETASFTDAGRSNYSEKYLLVHMGTRQD